MSPICAVGLNVEVLGADVEVIGVDVEVLRVDVQVLFKFAETASFLSSPP